MTLTLDLKTVPGGKGMAELARLIRKRSELMRQSSKDAVVASTIMVLQSLRKATRVRRKGKELA